MLQLETNVFWLQILWHILNHVLSWRLWIVDLEQEGAEEKVAEANKQCREGLDANKDSRVNRSEFECNLDLVCVCADMPLERLILKRGWR